MLLRLLSRLRSWLMPRRLPSRRQGTMLEPLESRIAPATFVNPHIVTYTDLHGDAVTIDSSLPIFTSSNASSLLHFNTGSVNGSNTTDQQLQTVDLTSLTSKQVSGDSISVTYHQTVAGQSFANVGFIESNFSLGHVTVQGDLGRIEAGVIGPANVSSVGLTSLSVYSLGAQGTTTQATGGNLLSSIYGSIGTITVQQDILNAQIVVTSNTDGAVTNGNVSSIHIGGNLTGTVNTTDSESNVITSGNITTSGNVGSIFIGGNMNGGSGTSSGSLKIGGRLGSLTVDGSIIGYTVSGDTTGQGASSASVTTGTNFPTTGGIGSVTVKGSVIGGDGAGSAEFSNSEIDTAGKIGSVTIGQNLTGGSGANSGEFYNSGGAIGNVHIGGTLTGGSPVSGSTLQTGQDSGEINGVTIGSVYIGTGIVGGGGQNSGLIQSPNGIGAITIHSGGITGGTAANSGAILAGTAPTDTGTETIPSIVIYGDITSTAASGVLTTNSPGQINSAVPIGSLTIHGSVIGSAGDDSGSIISSQPIGHLTILANGSNDHGSILGGAGTTSGEISALSFGTVSIAGQISGYTGTGGTGSGILASSEGIGSIIVGGLSGGTSVGSGQISVATNIGTLHVNGAIAGGVGASSGEVIAGGDVGSIVATSLTYPSGMGPGEISIAGNLGSLAFTGVTGQSTTVGGVVDVNGNVGAISVKGDIAGTVANTGLFNIGGAVNTISVTGQLHGGTGADSGSIFAGLDDTSRIGSVTITGGIFGGTSGAGSGEFFSGGGINKATLGDVIGGGTTTSDAYSGSVVTNGPIGTVNVTGLSTNPIHGVVGGAGDYSGVISSGSTMGAITVHGSIAGAGGTGSGAIVSQSIFTPTGDIQGNIGSIIVTGSITGGSGANSGQISAAGNLTTVSVAGSVIGESFTSVSSAVSGTGGILAGVQLTGTTGGNITTLKIGGALTGGTISAGAGDVTGSGYIEAGHIGSAVIGSITSGTVGTPITVTGDGAILAANDIASLTVTGSITGQASNAVTISAVGQVTPGKLDLAFGKIAVGSKVANTGNVTYTNFLAGYDQAGAPANGAASIGTVVVGGNWSESNLVAGVIAASNGNFGDPHATLITTSSTVVPTIASIIIRGNVTGSGAADTYGFVAKQIDAMSVDGHAQSLTLGVIDPVDPAGPDTDTVVREVTSLSV